MPDEWMDSPSGVCFWQIVIPLSKPALATVALFQFVITWNDFGSPLLYLNDPQKFPLGIWGWNDLLVRMVIKRIYYWPLPPCLPCR